MHGSRARLSSTLYAQRDLSGEGCRVTTMLCVPLFSLHVISPSLYSHASLLLTVSALSCSSSVSVPDFLPLMRRPNLLFRIRCTEIILHISKELKTPF
jgi:hypothetical protein